MRRTVNVEELRKLVFKVWIRTLKEKSMYYFFRSKVAIGAYDAITELFKRMMYRRNIRCEKVMSMICASKNIDELLENASNNLPPTPLFYNKDEEVEDVDMKRAERFILDFVNYLTHMFIGQSADAETLEWVCGETYKRVCKQIFDDDEYVDYFKHIPNKEEGIESFFEKKDIPKDRRDALLKSLRDLIEKAEINQFEYENPYISHFPF